METLSQRRLLPAGEGLETFLVEWKLVQSGLDLAHKPP